MAKDLRCVSVPSDDTQASRVGHRRCELRPRSHIHPYTVILTRHHLCWPSKSMTGRTGKQDGMLDAEELCNRGRDDGHGGHRRSGQCYVGRGCYKAARQVRRGSNVSERGPAITRARTRTVVVSLLQPALRQPDAAHVIIGACVPPTACNHQLTQREIYIEVTCMNWHHSASSVGTYSLHASFSHYLTTNSVSLGRGLRTPQSWRRHRDLASDRAAFSLSAAYVRDRDASSRGARVNIRYIAMLRFAIHTLATLRPHRLLSRMQ